jgi:hypothetical protein
MVSACGSGGYATNSISPQHRLAYFFDAAHVMRGLNKKTAIAPLPILDILVKPRHNLEGC